MVTRSLLRIPKSARLSIRCCGTRASPPQKGYFEQEKMASDRDSWSRSQEQAAPWWLRAFARKEGPSLDLYRYNPQFFTMQKFRDWKDQQLREAEISVQTYIEERHLILGNDLATATFIVFRLGKAKFVGQDSWHQLDEKTKKCPSLPTKFMKGWYLEAVDASNTEIRYEGLANFIGLPYLKWLSFANCVHVDDWFIDRITGELGPSLEYLDLSGCTGLTENMLSCMYRCENLKELVLSGIETSKSFQYGCLLLEDAIPGLRVSGVQYMDLSAIK